MYKEVTFDTDMGHFSAVCLIDSPTDECIEQEMTLFQNGILSFWRALGELGQMPIIQGDA